MKKIIISTIILILAISMISMPLAAADNLSNPPTVAAHGAILMDAKTGRVLWEKNSEAPMAMASTTKIMTAIIALENGNLEDMVTVSERAARSPEVNMNLTAGEELKLRDLLYALMLMSYNDTAVAIAEHISGDVETFCRIMTDKARELGAINTVFETPSGLDAGDHHSTAYDMALITRYALENQQFMEIINTSYITIGTNKRTIDLRNKNRLLSEYEGALGVKTGFTGKAGQCFVGSAQRDGMKLISVVFASGWGDAGREQKWVDTKRILDYGFLNYKYVELVEEGDIPGHIDVTRTRNPRIDIALEEGLMLPLNPEEASNIKIQFEYPEEVQAPIYMGQIMGQGIISLEGDILRTINLIAQEEAERHDLQTSLKKVLENWLEMGTNRDVDLSGFEVFK
ncbi:MAG: D-alanyl-D-alanine carboxypeptidase [Defluviitaleaceae bacterium]|nr:D-alanyl-D-alanine carboxypeptidase [Defluviitaleaceae bacterium]